MSELFDYGISSSNDKKCVVASRDVPPLLYFSSGIQCLIQKILNVLFQKKGTIFYNRNLGSDLDSVLFDSDNSDTIEKIKNIIENALTSNIENINIYAINVEPNPQIANSYDISIVIQDDRLYTINLQLNENGLTVEGM